MANAGLRSLKLLVGGSLCFAAALPAQAQVWRSDQGDGTFRNPVLYADYPDPDIIRVGKDFYFVTTTFANAPGVTLLKSRDLVNWKIVGHVVPRLDGSPKFDLKDGGSYRTGFFAASLRHHRGTFYIAITPVGMKTRIYRSKSITGPWTYHELDREAFDPGLFFDDDGKAYIATSIGSDGTVTLLTLNKDLTAVESSKVIHYVQGIEGSKLIKRGRYYYLFNALPRRLELLVSRSTSLFGPWETRPQISTSGKTGGHQGALVDLPDGSDFGFVMFDAGSIGRMTNISPVHWVDGWPVWGTREKPGRVPDRARKPIMGQPFSEPPSSDTFSGRTLGLQWQWNHNPDNSRWSLTERPGFLRLRATQARDLWSARNTLIQKGQGPRSRAIIKASTANLKSGDTCGLGTFGKFSAQLAVVGQAGGRRALRMQVTESTVDGPKTEVRAAAIPIRGADIWLRTDMDFTQDVGRVAYSFDGRRWTEVGGTFPLKFDWRTGTFQGEQIAISCYNPGPNGGAFDVDSFTLQKL